VDNVVMVAAAGAARNSLPADVAVADEYKSFLIAKKFSAVFG
jgi:hypothetical protein